MIKKDTELLKYMTRVAFASYVCVVGIAIYEFGCKDESLLLKTGGLVSVGCGIYEMAKNSVLSVKSTFKNNLESKTK